jgi:WD40 repeat protein
MHRSAVVLAILFASVFVFAQPSAQLVVQQGQSELHSITFSSDGTMALTAGDDIAVLWETATGSEIRAFNGHAAQVNFAAFSSSGRQIVTSSDDRTARVWDVATGRELHRFTADAFVTSAVFSPDEKRVLTGDTDGNVTVWEVASGKKLLSVRVAEASQALVHTSVAFSPDGQQFATASRKTAQIWNARNGQEVRRFDGHTYPINSICFSPDGHFLLTGSNDKTAKLWEAATGREVRQFQDVGPVKAAAFSPDGLRIVTGNEQGKVHVWDETSGRLLLTLPKPVGVQPIADSELAGKSADEQAALFLQQRRDAAINSALQMADAGAAVGGVAFSSDGTRIAVAGSAVRSQSNVLMYDSSTGDKVATFEGNSASNEFETATLAFAPDASQFWTEGPVRWDMRTGVPTFIGGTSGAPLPFALSHDGARVAIAISDGEENHLLLFDTATQNKILEFAPNNGPDQTFRIMGQTSAMPANPLRKVSSLLFSPDDSKLISIGREFNTEDDVRLWDVRSGKQLGNCANDARNYGPTGMPSSLPHSVVFTPDSRQVFQAGDDKWFRLRDGQTCVTVTRFDIRTVPQKPGDLNDEAATSYNFSTRQDPLAIAFSPNQKQFLLGTGSGRIGSSSLAASQILWTRELGIENPVDTAIFNADGSQVVTVADNQLLLLDAATGREVFRTDDVFAPVNGLANGPGGNTIVSSHADGTIRFWSRSASGLRVAATLFTTEDGGWGVVDSVGRFDTNRLDDNRFLHWVVSDEPNHPLPLEIFMRQYYTPKLLPQLLTDAKLPALPNIAELSRAQPVVKILSAAPSTEPGRVRITVHANRTVNTHGQNSGLRDLRIFRDGHLIHFIEGPLKDGDFTADGIALPKGNSKVTITAYAFSDALVKSSTASLDYEYHSTGQPERHAYLLQIGENHYRASDCELQFSVNDANRLNTILAERLKTQGYQVIAQKLISTAASPKASRDDIRDALKAIAGQASPDDAVFLSFSGHGYTSPDGEFYVLPSDVEGSCRRADATLLKNAISSDDLAAWLRPIDAGEMVLILDSCYSAQSVEANGFKPGPMGSRGLGQLAYDKRMRIIVASQSDQAAGEDARLGQGVLSYVLAEEGLAEGKADWKPKDGKITVGEWLSFAVNEVPKLDVNQVKAPLMNKRGLIAEDSASPLRNQVPAVFDFSTQDNFVLQ